MKIRYELEKEHITQLHKLYQKVVENSHIVIAMLDENNELQEVNI